MAQNKGHVFPYATQAESKKVRSKSLSASCFEPIKIVGLTKNDNRCTTAAISFLVSVPLVWCHLGKWDCVLDLPITVFKPKNDKGDFFQGFIACVLYIGYIYLTKILHSLDSFLPCFTYLFSYIFPSIRNSPTSSCHM